jgi:hypothetical protein
MRDQTRAKDVRKQTGKVVTGLSALSVVLVLAASVPSLSGSVGGSISGLVKDSSGAVIPHAEVLAVNTATGVSHTLHTDAAGFYSFPALPIGMYEVRVRQRGFREFVQTGLVINANSALRVDATLEVGHETQTVTVSATAVHVETTSTQMGEVIGSTKMTAIPLNGRSYTDLLALQPGVVPVSSGEYSGTPVSGGLNPGNLSVSGQREDANGFMVNGGDVQEDVQMGTAIIPNLDSIAEFRILTDNADAEYGNYSGGLVNAITKSGTNQFHGDAFEFLRNSSMDARNFFSPSRGVLHQNQFGGTFGGPIRRDKVFFFADYQGSRVVQGVDTGLIPVPSAADRTGNLFDIASSLTGKVNGGYWAQTLSQELGYPVSAGESYYTGGCTNNTQCVFPNAQIPSSAWSAPAKKLLQYIPTPNSGASTFTTAAFDNTLQDDKGSGRLDANTRVGLLSGYYFIDNYSQNAPYPSATVPGFNALNIGRAQDVNFAITKSFGPSSVNEFRLNYVRDVNTSDLPVGGLGVSLSSLGFAVGPNTPGIVPLAPQYQGVPNIAFNNYTIGIPGYFATQTNNTYQVLDNFSIVKGTHTFKFGGSTHYDLVTYHQDGAQDGTFGFNGSETGSDFLDFLLGAPNFYQQGEQIPFHTRTRYYSLYGQDSWRATPKLTVNYGLRWEVSTPWYEAFGEMETLVYGEQSVVFPGAPKGWVFPGDPGIPKTIAHTRYDNFAPRIGFAYSPEAQSGWLGKLLGGSGMSSFRGAYGIYYTAFEDAAFFNAQGDAPYGFYWSSPTPPLFATPFIARESGVNEGQRFPAPLPPPGVSAQHPDNNVNWSQYEPISSSPGVYHNNRLPYAEHYDASFQRQFGADTLLSVSYVGTQGHGLLGDVEANPGVPAVCLGVSQMSEVVPGTPTCGPFGENGVYQPITGGVINGTRAPFGPLFASDALFATMANSNYNALETTVRHTAGRLEFLAGYTYSKALDNASGWGAGGDLINPVNPKLSKSLSAFDVTNNFVTSYSYRLPFDKLWRSNRLTNGWLLTGITRFTTGLPVFLQEPDDNALLGTNFSGPCGCGVDEPNVVPGSLRITDPRTGNPAAHTNPYFNTSLFSKEAIGQLGNANRRYFHGPGINDFDMALLKDVRLTESKSLEFRAEFFNIFNHAQFEIPSGDATGNILSSSFGYITAANPGRIGQVAIKFLF